MAVTALDTHQTVKELTAAGFTDAQAEALTGALRRAQDVDLSNLATKPDLAEMRASLGTDFVEVRREIAEVKADMAKWMVGVAFAIVGAIIAVQKLFPSGHP